MYYHNVLAFIIDKRKGYILFSPALYLFSLVWSANISMNTVQVISGIVCQTFQKRNGSQRRDGVTHTNRK